MAVKFEDYYETLGLKRDASQDDIRRAYRKLARKHHPDVNKSEDAAAQFAKINEAYEVLNDPEKRRKYDQLGQNWKNGQDFRPPPGFEDVEFEFRGPGGGGGEFRPGGFSDFFEMFFGRGGAGGRGGASSFEDLFEQQRRGGERFTRSDYARRGSSQPAEQEVELAVSLDEVFHGGKRQIEVTDGRGKSRKIEVKIPVGASHGSRVRLKGERIILRIKIAPHPRFEVSGHDLTTDLYISPAEAALGAKVDLKTFDGPMTITVPAGAQSGQKLRVRGRGMPKGKHKPGERGDLFVRLLIRVPHPLSDEERELYEKLMEVSKFNPRPG